MNQTYSWSDIVPFWKVENGRLTRQAEHDLTQEARGEITRFVHEQGLDPLPDTFTYRLVTRMSNGSIVEMVMDELGPQPRFRPANTYGLPYRAAIAASARSTDSAMAYIANRAATGFKPEPEATYAKELVFQSTMKAVKLIRPEPFDLVAKYID